jgi:hypothetical protein
MPNVLSVKREYQMQKWAQRIRECQTSGFSNRVWCEQNGIALKTYYYHLNKLRKKAVEYMETTKAPELVEISLQTEQSIANNKRQICLHYHDTILDIPSGTNRADIMAVLEAVKGAC